MKYHHIFRLAITAVATIGSEAKSRFTGKTPKVAIEVK